MNNIYDMYYNINGYILKYNINKNFDNVKKMFTPTESYLLMFQINSISTILNNQYNR